MFKAQHTIITPVVGYNFKTALTVHNIFTHKGAFLAELPIVELQANHIHSISFTSYRVPIYTPWWRAAMWIKWVTEGQMYQALTWIEPATLWSRVKGSLQYTMAPPHIASWEPDEEYPTLGVIKFWILPCRARFTLLNLTVLLLIDFTFLVLKVIIRKKGAVSFDHFCLGQKVATMFIGKNVTCAIISVTFPVL